MPHTFYPTNVEQISSVPDQEIAWTSNPTTNINYLVNATWKPVRDLKHIANPATGDQRMRTYDLYCTGFNIPLLEQIQGIKLSLTAQRYARIVDETIQLTYQGQPIGINNFSYQVDPDNNVLITNESTYGGSEDLWGAELMPEMLQDPSFGVILKFQSHPYFPHSCGMFLYSVAITIY